MNTGITSNAMQSARASGGSRGGTSPDMDIGAAHSSVTHALLQPMSSVEMRRRMGELRLAPLTMAYDLGVTCLEVQRWRHGRAAIPGFAALYLRAYKTGEATL